jgi:hypothetical protein
MEEGGGKYQHSSDIRQTTQAALRCLVCFLGLGLDEKLLGLGFR